MRTRVGLSNYPNRIGVFLLKKIFGVTLALVLAAFSVSAPVHAEASRGSATIVMELETREVLYSSNPNLRLPMASTTKIMTALLALEQPDIDGRFIVDSGAIRVEGSSMGLTEGDDVSLRALAGGMLTASGNDAANAAAVRIAGDSAAFATMMNERAAAIGMVDSNFVTPSGLDDEQHYSTAYDMALLAREALKNPLFLEMCSSKKLRLNFGNPPYDRTLYNHNRLLSLYPSAIGVKTGFTKESGRCLVSAARERDVTLIIVTLNCGDDWNVHMGLYERYFPAVQRSELPSPDNLSLPVAGGKAKSVELAVAEPFSTVEVNGHSPEVKSEIFTPQFAYAPIKRGDIMGKIVYYIGNEFLGESDLVATQAVEAAPPVKKSWLRRLKQSIDDRLWEAAG